MSMLLRLPRLLLGGYRLKSKALVSKNFFFLCSKALILSRHLYGKG